MSKGSNRRPQKISKAEMDKRWAMVFGKPKPAKQRKQGHN
jgi:hypothetical protein